MSYVKDTRMHSRQSDNNTESTLKKTEDEIRPDDKPARAHEAKLQRLRKIETLPENIKKVIEFDKECEQNGHKIASRCSTLGILYHLCQFASQKSFRKFTKADIIEFLDASKYRRFEDTRYRAKANPDNVEKELANSSMNLTRHRVKRFFQWLYSMEKGQYPENVRWMEIKVIQGDRELTPEDLPTAQEVKQMIECTENPRDRALISLMAESGARIGEISTLRLKDICWNENGFILSIRGAMSKSKFTRRIPLCACAEDVKRLINDYHPFKNDHEAPLFISFTSRKTPENRLKIVTIAGIVRKIAIRAGVEKRIHMYPHKFRHLRASQLAELGWNEPMLRQYFGWTKTSKMPAIYIHMSQKSLNNRYYQMYGKVDHQEVNKQNLEEPMACSGCGTRNPSGYRFCFRCNAMLGPQEQKRIEDEKQVKHTLNFIATHPDFSERFTQLLKEAVKRQQYEHLTSTPVSE